MRGNAHVSRTHAHPAPCVFYFYVFARCTLDLSKALILSTIRLRQTCAFFVMFCGILRNYFSIFAIDTRWIYMKFAQKMYRLFVYEMCEYQDQGRIIVI